MIATVYKRCQNTVRACWLSHFQIASNVDKTNTGPSHFSKQNISYVCDPIRRPVAQSLRGCLVGCLVQQITTYCSSCSHNTQQHVSMSASDEEAELALLEEIEKSQGE
jgi:hypothetical protein